MTGLQVENVQSSVAWVIQSETEVGIALRRTRERSGFGSSHRVGIGIERRIPVALHLQLG